MQKTSIDIKVTVSQNLPPSLDPSILAGVTLPLNSNQDVTITTLDPEGDTVNIAVTSMPIFGTFTLPNTLSFNPTLFSEVGIVGIDVTLSDQCNTAKETFAIEVTNSAPYFETTLASLIIHIDLETKFSLPNAIDDEGHSITI